MSHNFSVSAPVFIPSGSNPAPISSSSPFEASPDAYSFFGIHPIEGGPKIVEQVNAVEEQPQKMLTFRDLEKMMKPFQKNPNQKSRLTRRDLERMKREEEDDEMYYQEYKRKHIEKSQSDSPVLRKLFPGSPSSPLQKAHSPINYESRYYSGVTTGPVHPLINTYRGYY